MFQQWVQAIKARIFKKPPVVVDPYREKLLEDMARAIARIRTAMEKYEDALRHTDDDGVNYSQMLFNQLDGYVTDYMNLRLQYEAMYGDLENYYQKFTKLRIWQERGEYPCLFLHRFKTATIPFTLDGEKDSAASA